MNENNEIKKIFLDLGNILNNITSEWTSRLAAIKELDKICSTLQGQTLLDLIFETEIHLSLAIQLQDRRSSYLKELCSVLSNIAGYIGSSLPYGFDDLAVHFLPILTEKLLVVTIKVIAKSGDDCIVSFLKYCGKHTLNSIVTFLSHPHPVARAKFAEYLNLFLQSKGSDVDPQLIVKGLSIAVQDSSATTRQQAKECFNHFQKNFPEESQQFLSEQPPNIQKMLNLNSSADSSNRRTNFKAFLSSKNKSDSSNTPVQINKGENTTSTQFHNSSIQKENLSPNFPEEINSTHESNETENKIESTYDENSVQPESPKATNKYAFLLDYESGHTPIAMRLRSKSKNQPSTQSTKTD